MKYVDLVTGIAIAIFAGLMLLIFYSTTTTKPASNPAPQPPNVDQSCIQAQHALQETQTILNAVRERLPPRDTVTVHHYPRR